MRTELQFQPSGHAASKSTSSKAPSAKRQKRKNKQKRKVKAKRRNRAKKTTAKASAKVKFESLYLQRILEDPPELKDVPEHKFLEAYQQEVKRFLALKKAECRVIMEHFRDALYAANDGREPIVDLADEDDPLFLRDSWVDEVRRGIHTSVNEPQKR